jgi:hypothetical protein
MSNPNRILQCSKKVQLEIAVGETYLYFMDKNILTFTMNREYS